MSKKTDFDFIPGKPRKLTKQDEEAIKHAAKLNLVQQIQELESQAHHLGVHVTGHALNRAKNALGWEISGDIEEAGRASRGESAA
jgi:hypothetical protein